MERVFVLSDSAEVDSKRRQLRGMALDIIASWGPLDFLFSPPPFFETPPFILRCFRFRTIDTKPKISLSLSLSFIKVSIQSRGDEESHQPHPVTIEETEAVK